ncbi:MULTISPECIES: glutamate ABC transporter substrate-binding protein [Bifidobacterium]|uniref:glutamate ABC transporter substrate-binding protein n=1 Tax=Bifidobacterium TaxID=1678 RepID=UPI0018DB170D|nr:MULTISPECIES: glutamate ABC transporter substrate-binding protein [Bifidobacterium]MBH9980541.1 glutamate ABC transporter substrate-binding protein [Bifidobacterium asteroides]MBI0099928.1 glutamate ABC transporter substrate-binding protein [Bifidobacterium sp. W8114]
MFARRIAAALAALVLAVPLSGCGLQEDPYRAGSIGPKISVGISFDQPGLGFAQSGRYRGLDVDVAQYVVHELGYAESQIVFRQVKPSDRERMLEQGQVDMVVAGYSITQERQKLVDFAGPYLAAGQDLLVRRTQSDIAGVEDLAQKRVCVAAGATSGALVRSLVPQAQVQERDEFPECVTALLSGDTDAVSGDDFALAGLAHVRGGGQLRLVGNPFSHERYGIGLPHGDPELVDIIDQALKRMMQDGSFKAALSRASKSIGFSLDAAARTLKPGDH